MDQGWIKTSAAIWSAAACAGRASRESTSEGRRSISIARASSATAVAAAPSDRSPGSTASREQPFTGSSARLEPLFQKGSEERRLQLSTSHSKQIAGSSRSRSGLEECFAEMCSLTSRYIAPPITANPRVFGEAAEDWRSALEVPTAQGALDCQLYPILMMVSRDLFGVGSDGHQRNRKDQH